MSVIVNERAYTAFLDCTHEVRYSRGEPSPGDIVFCTKCYDYKVILHCGERYGANCRHCKYARSYGGPISAMTFAEKHSRKFSLHVIDVYGPNGFHQEVTTQPKFDLVDCPF